MVKNRFSCLSCGDVVPFYYRGPVGHAPEKICLDCWLAFKILGKQSNIDKKDIAFAALADGNNKKTAASKAGVNPKTLTRWLKNLKNSPDELKNTLRRFRGNRNR